MKQPDCSDWMMTQFPGSINLARTSKIMLIRTNKAAAERGQEFSSQPEIDVLQSYL